MRFPSGLRIKAMKRSEALRMIARLPGYDASRAGEIISIGNMFP
jgi:hypothetical protein